MGHPRRHYDIVNHVVHFVDGRARRNWRKQHRIPYKNRRLNVAKIRSVAVFCGASMGVDPIWQEAATALGRGLAERGIRLVYGGGSIGLMGVVADAALAAGGNVIGIIPEFLRRREIDHPDLMELEVTDSMHSRKLRMFDLSDAFISIAGGLGTLDETIEILTWRQLGLHDKPILICDVAGSAKPLLAAIEATIEMGFARPSVRDLYTAIDGIADLLDVLSAA
jgi:uncharacterized protein (TIGR00730 family)